MKDTQLFLLLECVNREPWITHSDISREFPRAYELAVRCRCFTDTYSLVELTPHGRALLKGLRQCCARY